MPLERGSLLNKRYRIMDILGQGGMAAIYRAVDENLGVEVAVKENLFTTDDYARQFRYEAVILASLRHPNLPRVTDHFVIEGQGQYLVMDYIEGEDLRQRMDRMGVLNEAEAIILGVAICDALIYLHSRNPCVLHRDIKPGNVKITPQGEVFLVDFGLAKVVRAGEATETGARAMTPGYSPPEQYGTARTDIRSDVYSLGATLYSALSNSLPEDALARAMDQAQLTPVSKHNSKVSRRLEAVIEKSLAVKPEDRYQTDEEFRQALLNSRNTGQRGTPLDLVLSPPPYRNSFDQHPIRAESLEDELDEVDSQQPGNRQPVRRRSRPVGWLGIIVIGLLLALGTGAYWLNPGLPGMVLAYMMPADTSTPPAEPSQTPKPATQVPVAFVKSNSSTPLPTGTVTPTALPVYTDPPPTLTPTITLTPLPTHIGGGYGQIAFSSDETGMPEIWLINLDGTRLQKLTSINEGACQPSWSPDGKRLVFISPCGREADTYRGSSLFLINADGSNLQPLPSVPGGDFDPSWSPDGTRIAFTSLRGGEYKGIYVLNLENNTVLDLKDPDGRDAAEPAWSPDGLQIAYAGPRNQIWAMSADGSNRRVLTRNAGENKKGHPAWSPDGKAVVYTEWEDGRAGMPWLAAVAISDTSPSISALKGLPMSKAAYSPDGFWLVYQSWPATQYRHIFLMMPNGVNRRQLTDGDRNDIDPAWRPSVIVP